jgi:hypothetical protein
MKKRLFCFILLPALVFTACSKNSIEIKNFDDVFEKTAYHAAKYETPIPDHVIDAEAYKDSLFFFTVHEGASLFKLDLKTNKITRLSKNGKEEGEYQSPFALQVESNRVYFNDIFNNKLQVLDFNGRYLRDYKIKRFVMSLRFYRDKNDLVYLNNGGYGFDNYLARNDDKTFFKVPLKFRDYPMVKAPINIFEHEGVLYFASPFEYKIFTLNLASGAEGFIELKGIKEMFDWNRFEGNKINRDDILSIETIQWNSKPVCFEKLMLNNKLYFLFTVNSVKDVETTYLFDITGKGITAFNTKDNTMFGSYNNKIFFYNVDSKAKLLKGFTEYKLKEGIIK